MSRIVVLAVLLVAPPASAQSLEVSALFGYSNSGPIDQKTRGVDELEVGSGFTWGGAGTFFFSDHFGLEGFFTQHLTATRITSEFGSADVFDMTTTQVLANVVFQPFARDATLQPFVFGGAGATFFNADDFESDTKFAWTVGGGLKWFPTAPLGVRMQVRYRPTVLGGESAEACVPFAFCQGMLNQIEYAAGLILRF